MTYGFTRIPQSAAHVTFSILRPSSVLPCLCVVCDDSVWPKPYRKDVASDLRGERECRKRQTFRVGTRDEEDLNGLVFDVRFFINPSCQLDPVPSTENISCDLRGWKMDLANCVRPTNLRSFAWAIQIRTNDLSPKLKPRDARDVAFKLQGQTAKRSEPATKANKTKG